MAEWAEMSINGRDMESPLLNGGGVVKSVEDVRRLSRTGVGAILGGSFTLEPRPGNGPNGEVVYYHDSEAGVTTNSLGMPNKGLRAVARELPEMIAIAHDGGKPFVLNLAPVSTDPVAEVIEMAHILDRAHVSGIDAIELNASCPNVVTEDGGRHSILSHNPEQLTEVLLELSDVNANEFPFGDLWVRVSPFESRGRQTARQLAHALYFAGVDAVSAFNTFPGGRPLDASGQQILQVPGGIGGQSGPGMMGSAEAHMHLLAEERDTLQQRYGHSFEIVGSNGVYDALSMKRRLDMGASAVSATTLFYESVDWKRAVDKVLRDYVELLES